MLGPNSYGKSGIRLVKLRRREDRDDLMDLTVSVRFEGEFTPAHVAGENTGILPTDTMKNTVYALAKDHPLADIESFGLELARHFLVGNPQVSRVSVAIEEHPWERLTVRERPHAHAFRRAGEETRVAAVARTRETATVEAGVEGLLLLKSRQSAFSGFRRDLYTTLKETRDRVLATSVTARWLYSGTDVAFSTVGRGVRQTLLETFADHDSESVQHTLYAMGQSVLERHAEVEEVRLSLPNKHHLSVDLSPFGLENRNEIFVATEEPYGLIEATVKRNT
jgi:urate oxidase